MNNQQYMTNYGVVFRIYPNEEQKKIIAMNAGCSRFVYNQLLNQYNEDYFDFLELVNEIKQDYDIDENMLLKDFMKEYKDIFDLEYPKLEKYSYLLNEYEFLNENVIDSKCLDLSRRNLNSAMGQFFKDMKKSSSSVKKGRPQFKKKDLYTMSYQTSIQGKKQETLFNKKGYVSLPKLKNVKINKHCNIEGRVTTIKVFMDNLGKYYVSCTVQNDNATIIPMLSRNNTDDILGLDVGLDKAIITSNGDKIPHLVSKKEINKLEKRRTHYQRQMARRNKDSKRYNKSRVRKSKIDKKISNKIQNSNHKVVNEVLKLSDHFNIEDLRTKKITEDKRNKSKSLNKSLRQRSLSSMLVILEYKAENQGKTVRRISNYYASTQLCSSCGYQNKQLKNNCAIRTWTCPECNSEHDRDINAAINIRDYKFA